MDLHEENERVHLRIMEELTRVTGSRTRLIPVWHMAGFATGFLPALLGGQRAIYHTVSDDTAGPTQRVHGACMPK